MLSMNDDVLSAKLKAFREKQYQAVLDMKLGD
jgi:phosphoribosylcarboxyaminoimidazole (NCAIR) mutase